MQSVENIASPPLVWSILTAYIKADQNQQTFSWNTTVCTVKIHQLETPTTNLIRLLRIQEKHQDQRKKKANPKKRRRNRHLMMTTGYQNYLIKIKAILKSISLLRMTWTIAQLSALPVSGRLITNTQEQY